jgi:hypothetical protein
MKKKMGKTTKTLFIVFGIGIAGMAVMIAVILGTKLLASRDNAATIAVGEQTQRIVLDTDKATVIFVASDERKIETALNLWAESAIDVRDVALVTTDGSALIITETPPTDKFLGLFAQPYELKITIYAPQGMIDDIDRR